MGVPSLSKKVRKRIRAVRQRDKTPGFARPGSTVRRVVLRGPGAGDTVVFKANSARAGQPGKLKPRRVVKDISFKKTQQTLKFGKKSK